MSNTATTTTRGDEAMSNTTDTYSIVVIRDMYQPDWQGDGAPAIVRSQDDDSELIGLSLEKAREIVAELDNTVYVTRNNEAGRPEYFAVADGDAEYYTNGRNSDLGNYDWTSSECRENSGNPCATCNDCAELIRDQDCDGVRTSAIE